jgi:hypothetical protein
MNFREACGFPFRLALLLFIAPFAIVLEVILMAFWPNDPSPIKPAKFKDILLHGWEI